MSYSRRSVIFSQTCSSSWAFIVTFKDGNLPSVWEEVPVLQALSPDQYRYERHIQGQELIEQTFRWINDIDYQGHALHWLECLESVCNTQSGKQTCGRFVHLTNLPISSTTVSVLSGTGRLRWKIENEGFNTQKLLGYGLQHK